jgi:hypothetical protein
MIVYYSIETEHWNVEVTLASGTRQFVVQPAFGSTFIVNGILSNTWSARPRRAGAPTKSQSFPTGVPAKKKPSGGGFDGTNSKKILIDVLETASNETGNNFYLNVCSLLI